MGTFRAGNHGRLAEDSDRGDFAGVEVDLEKFTDAHGDRTARCRVTKAFFARWRSAIAVKLHAVRKPSKPALKKPLTSINNIISGCSQ